MFEGASKQTPDLKILLRRDRPPPRSEIPESATGDRCITSYIDLSIRIRTSKNVFLGIYISLENSFVSYRQ